MELNTERTAMRGGGKEKGHRKKKGKKNCRRHGLGANAFPISRERSWAVRREGNEDETQKK